jgi:hypothetical protein
MYLRRIRCARLFLEVHEVADELRRFDFVDSSDCEYGRSTHGLYVRHCPLLMWRTLTEPRA